MGIFSPPYRNWPILAGVGGENQERRQAEPSGRARAPGRRAVEGRLARAAPRLWRSRAGLERRWGGVVPGEERRRGSSSYGGLSRSGAGWIWRGAAEEVRRAGPHPSTSHAGKEATRGGVAPGWRAVGPDVNPGGSANTAVMQRRRRRSVSRRTNGS